MLKPGISTETQEPRCTHAAFLMGLGYLRQTKGARWPSSPILMEPSITWERQETDCTWAAYLLGSGNGRYGADGTETGKCEARPTYWETQTQTTLSPRNAALQPYGLQLFNNRKLRRGFTAYVLSGPLAENFALVEREDELFAAPSGAIVPFDPPADRKLKPIHPFSSSAR